MPRRTPAAPPAAVTPVAYALAVVAAYRRHGRDPAEALELAQITPACLAQQESRITARQLEQLSSRAMQELDDEALGAYGRRLPWGSYGMLARASLTSPDLGIALKRWCRHHGLLTEDIALELAAGGPLAVVSLRERRALAPELREFSIVYVLRNVHGLACWYIDSRIPLAGAAFPFRAPAHADAYTHMFAGGPVHFDAPHAEIRFDARYLALPLKRDEKALQQMLQRALPIAVLQYRRDRLIVEQVRTALAAHPAHTHSAEGVAELLNMSKRTLHRQLAREGAALQQLKDEVRCERAKQLLLRTAQPLKQVAAAVGFHNEKSFIRAFAQWTGTTPAAFRSS